MKNAIILHGMPLREEYFAPGGNRQSQMHWLGWLKNKLIEQGLVVENPEMPEPYEPDYEQWRSVFERYPVNENTMLIGHSCGAGFLVRWLSERKVKVGKVVLVAPWLDLNHELKNGFFDFKIDQQLVRRTAGVTVLVSSDDDQEVLESVRRIQSTSPGIAIKEFSDRGHFIFASMYTEEFPELLEVLIE